MDNQRPEDAEAATREDAVLIRKAGMCNLRLVWPPIIASKGPLKS